MRRSIIAILLGFTALPAQALDFDAGPVTGTLNTRISFGAAMRVQHRDERLIAKLAVPGLQDLCAADDWQSQTGNHPPTQRLADARRAISGGNGYNGTPNNAPADHTAP